MKQSWAFRELRLLRGVCAERSEVLVMTFSCFVAVVGTAKQGKQPDSIPTSWDSARNDRHTQLHFVRASKKKNAKMAPEPNFFDFF